MQTVKIVVFPKTSSVEFAPDAGSHCRLEINLLLVTVGNLRRNLSWKVCSKGSVHKTWAIWAFYDWMFSTRISWIYCVHDTFGYFQTAWTAKVNVRRLSHSDLKVTHHCTKGSKIKITFNWGLWIVTFPQFSPLNCYLHPKNMNVKSTEKSAHLVVSISCSSAQPWQLAPKHNHVFSFFTLAHIQILTINKTPPPYLPHFPIILTQRYTFVCIKKVHKVPHLWFWLRIRSVN